MIFFTVILFILATYPF